MTPRESIPPGAPAGPDGLPAAPHAHPAAEVLRALGTDPDRGLDPAEAARRRERHGPNRLRGAAETPWWRHLAEQFRSVLVLILVAATAISALEWWLQPAPRETALPYEAIVILAIVLLNALLGTVQEARAERSVRALMALAAPEATVLRGGERRRVPTADLVPGDLLLVEAGDRIAADARLVEAAGLSADEAALTGESLPVPKDPAPVAAGAGLGDRRGMLFAGTVAAAGRGRAVVVATGMRTEVGRIAGMLEAAAPEATPLQKELDRTGRRLTVVMLGICAAVFAAGLLGAETLDRGTVLSLFLFAVALAVAAIPEALPAIVTVGLSLGVRRMAARGAIVRKLPAVETLGATTVICSDKTGTLTRNEMTVRVLLPGAGSVRVDLGGSGYAPEGEATLPDGTPLPAAGALRGAAEALLRAAALANDAALARDADGRWRVQGDPTEGALLVAARKLGLDGAALAGWTRLGEIPFTSERKRHATLHRIPGEPDAAMLFVKGAPEVVLGRCRRVAGADGTVLPLDAARREAIARGNEALAGQALRTLAVAARRLPAAAAALTEGEKEDLVLLGILGMMDPPRAEAAEAVAVARRAGVRTVMITGDHPATAVAVARELGMLEGGGGGARVLTGAELRRMDQAALEAAVEQVRVYARVDPEHKLGIVRALQRRGHVVAMTGDGINDAPALKAADIGIAMGITGTDVSKEAADMVLTDDNFASIVRAVEEGRGIFDNIRKYLVYLLSSNAGELLTMFAGVMAAGALGLVPEGGAGVFLPLLAVQLLWINLVTDGPPALALGLDPKAPDVMRRAPRRQGGGVLDAADWWHIGGAGLVMMLGTLGVLDASYPGGLLEPLAGGAGPNHADEDHARTMAFTTLMMFQLWHAFVVRTGLRSTFAGLAENRWLLVAVVCSLAAQAMVVHVPALQEAFRTVPLSAGDWLVAAGVGSTLALGAEGVKAGLRRRAAAPG